MGRTVIETSHLSIGYRLKGGRRFVVHGGIDIALHRGEVTCLLGLNGAGKSTLLRTLAGFQDALGGEVTLLGKPLGSYSQSELSLCIGVVLTEKTNAGGITVEELVSLGRHPYTGFFGVLGEHDKDVVRRSLLAAGIGHKARSYVSELSDGERQKAMIAKALAQECPVILLDEPTAFLDVTSRIDTLVLLRRLAREQQKTILLSTHDMELAIQLGDSLWLMAKDRPIETGAPEDLILSGSFESYFGKEGLRFDALTGKLSPETPSAPIGLEEGDPLATHWAANALTRNGWLPSSPRPGIINIRCAGSRQITITFPGGEQKEAHNMESLIEICIFACDGNI